MRKLKKSMKLWIARDKNNSLFIYFSKPKKEEDLEIWNCPDSITEIDEELFPEIKWEDEEPTEVTLNVNYD